MGEEAINAMRDVTKLPFEDLQKIMVEAAKDAANDEINSAADELAEQVSEQETLLYSSCWKWMVDYTGTAKLLDKKAKQIEQIGEKMKKIEGVVSAASEVVSM